MRIVRITAAAWVVACFTVMTVAVWVQVGGRYLFNYSISWTGELATISQIWMVLVGAGVAARGDLHARIDALVVLLPAAVRRIIMLLTLGLGLWFLGSIVVGVIPMMRLGQFQTTPALGLPMTVPYLGLVIGPIYFACEMVALTGRNWTGREPETEPAGQRSV
jgi:TRAP-type C4-dicarboxylate transport system permease small subunit